MPPFQYCYNCAPFHSNGRGPTLVPSPPSPAAATSPRSQTRAQSSEGDAEATDHGASSEASDASPTMAGGQGDFTIYDLDSRSTTENRSPSVLSRCSSPLKRRRRVSVSEDGTGEDDGDDGDVECKKRRDSDTAVAEGAAAITVEANSNSTSSCSSPDTSLNESGFESAPTSPDQQVCVGGCVVMTAYLHKHLSPVCTLRAAGRISRAIVS